MTAISKPYIHSKSPVAFLLKIAIGTGLSLGATLASGSELPYDAEKAPASQSFNTDNIENPGSSIEDEISGSIINYTITRTGHDFAYFFSLYTNTQFPNAEYNLIIKERPSARWGSLIEITYLREIIFRIFLHPTQSKIKTHARQAAVTVNTQINQLKIKQLFLDTFDLDKDEF